VNFLSTLLSNTETRFKNDWRAYMPKESAEGTQEPEGGAKEEGTSPSEPSSGLNLGRGLPPEFWERDDPENAVGPEASDEGEAPAQEVKPEETLAVEDPPKEEEGEVTAAPKLDEDLADLQRKYVESETERLRRQEEQSLMQEQLQELQPLLDLGAAVRNNPALYKEVVAKLKGEAPEVKAPTQKQAAKMTPGQFMDEIVQRVAQAIVPQITEQVSRSNTEQRAAERKFNKIDAKAHKEIDNFDVISKHPKFLKYVQFYSSALMDKNSPWNPGKEDPQFWAVRQAADAVMKDNPDYIKALTNAEVKKAALKGEKKAAASAIGSPSKTVPQKKRELTQDETDRLSMVQTRMKRSSMRRLPSAR
jgi:hypothetical protein